MRLGAYDCTIKTGTKTYSAYRSKKISERHRHRYEFNPKLRQRFDDSEFECSGERPDACIHQDRNTERRQNE